MPGIASLNTPLTEKRKQLVRSIEDKEVRDLMVSEHIYVGVPLQIRSLRKREGWTQKQLGEMCGQEQSRISLLERVGYEGYTVKTLCRIAAAYDVALIVKFAPFRELIDQMTHLSSESVLVDRYKEDWGLYPPEDTNQTAFSAINPPESTTIELSDMKSALSAGRRAALIDKPEQTKIDRCADGFI